MLFVLFQIGNDRYALETSRVLEILPLVNWKTVPQAPPGVAGIFNYHGSPVPLIDVSELALGRPSPPWMSTRIILVHYPAQTVEAVEEASGTRLLGLLAEQITTTLRRSESDFTDAGVAVDKAPYLGPVTTDAGSIIQRVEVERLLSAEVRGVLFGHIVEPV